MQGQFGSFLKEIGRNALDLLPIVGVVALFQALVIGEPLDQLGRRLVGGVLVLFGMTFFVRGLAMSILPLGERMARSLAERGSLLLLTGFAFALGFGSTMAEPALAAVSQQAGEAVAGDVDPRLFGIYLRIAVSLAVGCAVAFGVLRVVKGWPVAWFVLPGYAAATFMALLSQSALAAIGFDAGAAATSAINIPLMLALGIGLATMIGERNPLVDGFGLVALASLAPMLTINLFALVVG